MSYRFNLTIEKETSKLVLLGVDGEVASKEWSESRDMGRQLFQAIDGLLAEQGILPQDVSGFGIDSDVPDGYTSMRIAETVRRVYTRFHNFGCS